MRLWKCCRWQPNVYLQSPAVMSIMEMTAMELTQTNGRMIWSDGGKIMTSVTLVMTRSTRQISPVMYAVMRVSANMTRENRIGKIVANSEPEVSERSMFTDDFEKKSPYIYSILRHCTYHNVWKIDTFPESWSWSAETRLWCRFLTQISEVKHRITRVMPLIAIEGNPMVEPRFLRLCIHWKGRTSWSTVHHPRECLPDRNHHSSKGRRQPWTR